MINFIDSKITVISKIDDRDVITASKSKGEPANDVVINLFATSLQNKKNSEGYAALKKINGEPSSQDLGGEERGGDHA